MDDFERAAQSVAHGDNFDDAAAATVDDQRAGLRNALYDALLANPDVTARATRLGRQTGLAPDLVERNLPEIERSTRLDQLDALPKENPVLADWLADPVNARLAHDDLDTLGQFGQTALFRPPAAPQLRGDYGFAQASRDLRATQDRSASAVSQYVERNLPASEVFGRERTSLEGITEPILRGVARARRGITLLMGMAGLYDGDPAGLAVRLASQNRKAESYPVPENVQQGQRAISDAESFGEAAWAILTHPGAVKETVFESLGASAPSLLGAAGLSVFGPAGTAAGAGTGSFVVEYSSTLQDVMNENGINASDPLALHAALNNPDLMDAAREKALARGVPIAAFDAITAGFAGKLLLGAKPTAGSAATRTAGELGLQAGGGAAGEATAQYNTDEFKPGDILLEAIAELPTGVVEVPANYRHALDKAQRSEQQTKGIEELNNLAKASKVAARDPETFQTLIAAAAEDGPVQAVFIDAKTLMQSGLAPEMVKASPAVAAQLDRALLTGGQIAIPVDEYAARIAPTELAPQLLDHLKTEPDGFTRAEAQQYMQDAAPELQAEFERVLAEQQGDEAFRASADAVKANIKGQLDTAARFTPQVNDAYSALAGNWYAVQAARLGTTPEDLYQRLPLGIVAENVAGGQQFEQEAVESPEFKAWFGDSRVVDAEGKPMVVYHGTGADFDAFDRTKGRRGNLGDGIYFTPDANVASTFAGRTTFDKTGGNVMPVYVSLKNPAIVRGADIGAERAGHDGVIQVDDQGRIKTVVAFRPEQIKSATGNRGTFDPNDPNILHQSGLTPTEQAMQRWRDSLGRVNPRNLDYVPKLDTPAVLREMGVKDARIELPTRYLLAIRQKHPDVPLAVFENLPALLADPLLSMPSREGGIDVVIDAVSESGAPLVVGVRDGRVRTVTPIDPEDGRSSADRITARWNHALKKPGAKLYARNKEALTDARASMRGVTEADRADVRRDPLRAAPGLIPLHRDSHNTANVVTRTQLVKKRGAEFYQKSTAPRGAFNPETLQISLLKGADLSTFLHETGHFFLEAQIDMAGRLQQEAQTFGVDTLKPGERELLADTDALLRWFGVRDLAEWHNLDFEEKRIYHEQFARGFEAYLFEGNAPSIELQGLFQRFRAWLLNVYRDLKVLNVELTDEVRGVMDRMLATNEQIQLAEQGRSMMPLFASPEQAGMTPEEFAAYQALGVDATNEAAQDLQARGLRDMQWLHNTRGRVIKKLKKQSAARRAEMQMDARREVMSQPLYRAWDFLTRKLTDNDKLQPQDLQPGEQVNNPAGLTAGRLDLGALAEMGVPDEVVNAVKARKMTAKDGLHPDLVADLFGFSSGDELVRALAAAETPKAEIDALTDVRMLENYGELATPEAIERAADTAIHNDARARFTATEANALAKATGRRGVLVSAAKEYAAAIIGRTKVRNLRPGQYTSMEAKAARAAKRAMDTGDLATAAAEKRNQVIQQQAARATYSAQEEVDRIVRHFKQIKKPGSQKNMRGDSLLQMNALLARFDLRTKPDDTRKPLADWVTEEAERLSAAIPALPGWVLDEQFVRPYKELTVAEMRELAEAVAQLEHLARREQNMYKAVRNQTYQAEVASVLDELKATNPDAFDDNGPLEYRKDALPLAKEMRARIKSKFDAEFINIENLLDSITSGNGRQVFESLFGRLSEAQDARTAMMKELGGFLREFTKAYSAKEKLEMAFTKRLVPNTRLYMTREQRIAVALFNGSEEGRQRLRDGNRYNEQQIQAIVDSLDEKDIALVQAMWRMSDEKVWPQLAAVNERTVGIAPPKVKAVPFVHSTLGALSGGYVPLVYDGDMDARAHDLNTNASVQDLLGGTATNAATQRSASKTRNDVVNRPLDLSLRGMAFKINETVHDITHREAVADTYRLLQNRELANTLRVIAGPDAYNALLYHVREVASKPRTPTGFMEKAFWYLRKNTLINMMGASFNTVAINVLGASPAIRRVGAARFIAAAGKLTGPGASERYHTILEKSDYMRQRLSSFDRDMNEELSRLNPSSMMPSMQFWFAGLSVMDRAITMPTWLAAYEQGLADNKNDDAAAVGFADRVIRQTQGSGRAVDLAKIAGGVGPAGEFKRILTMFYNFFGAQLGSIRRGAAVASGEFAAGNRAKAAGIITLDLLAIIVIPATLEAIARGNCGDDPDADDYLYCAARSSVLFAGGFFPILRDVLPYTWRQFDPDFTGGFGARLSPVENALETMARMPKAIMDTASGEATEADDKTLVRGFGYLFGLPGFQTWRTLDGYRALSEGETDNPAVLLTGPPKD